MAKLKTRQNAIEKWQREYYGSIRIFNVKKVLDLGFFYFQNSITAAYFADADYNVMRVNQNFNDFPQYSVTSEAFTFLKFLRLWTSKAGLLKNSPMKLKTRDGYRYRVLKISRAMSGASFPCSQHGPQALFFPSYRGFLGSLLIVQAKTNCGRTKNYCWKNR